MEKPFVRLDWLLRSAGLIRPAKVYSGFVIDETLYLLHTGRGWAQLALSDGAFKGMAENIYKQNQAKVRVNLEILDRTDIASEISARAEFAYPLAGIANISVVEFPKNKVAGLTINANGKGPKSLRLSAIDYLANQGERQRFLEQLPGVKYSTSWLA